MKRSLKYFVVLILAGVLVSCEKEKKSDSQIIGTWISENNADTLYVIDDHVFNKSLHDGIQHTFEYSFQNDSIIIQYKRPNKIWVLATSHYYTLKNGELMIDFSNGCYGFLPEKETFSYNGDFRAF
jgi:hypothetical protein